MSSKRLLPAPKIGIFQNEIASKELAPDKGSRYPHRNETITSKDVMKLFNKEDLSTKKPEIMRNSHEKPSKESPITFQPNNEPRIETVQSIRRWRWSPITCFEEFCVKVCVEVFLKIPMNGYPDPIEKTQLLLRDLHMGKDYSSEIEALFTSGEKPKELPAPESLIDNERREVVERNNNEVFENERKSRAMPIHSQPPRAHNEKNRVPDGTGANEYNASMKNLPHTPDEYNIPMKHLPRIPDKYSIPIKNLPWTPDDCSFPVKNFPWTPSEYDIPIKNASQIPIDHKIPFTESTFRATLPRGMNSIEEKYIETPSIVLRAIGKEDFHLKEKFNPVETTYRENQRNGKNRKSKKNEILEKSDFQVSTKFQSSGRQLNLDFGQAQPVHSRKTKKRHDKRNDEFELSSNAFLHNFKVLSFNDNPSKETSGSSKKQGQRFFQNIEQPKKYFAGNNKSNSFDLPRPIPIYHCEKRRRKRDFVGDNLEKQEYDPVRRYSSTLEYHDNIDPFNCEQWFTPEPQRNKRNKSHEKASNNNKIPVNPPDFVYRSNVNYNSYGNPFFQMNQKNNRSVKFNNRNSSHFY